jgi:CubicO group peptidase (beta-lactamase class C family)
MRALVLEPLGMVSSTFEFAVAQSQLTAGYRASMGPERPFDQVQQKPSPAVRMPIEGLYSTALDLGRLTAALLNDGVVGS